MGIPLELDICMHGGFIQRKPFAPRDGRLGRKQLHGMDDLVGKWSLYYRLFPIVI